MKCPHCKFKSSIRSSEELSSLTRKQYYQCSNIYCGHTFTAMQSVSETIVPSSCPDPKVNIPLSTSHNARRNAIKA
ncbi:ogr/Delta-like zinc finger family protein [Utexia brackfieldae]|uniref:ogr/Delta-like zinc finger family protein n=1 Tax=Utexia brackfieldae TaxID=3074108 RepID=UPI00370DAED6